MSLRLLILTCLIASLALVAGRSLAAQLPQLQRHSETLIRAEQGDQILLRTEVGPGPARVVWHLRTGRVCDGSQCEIDTSPWGPGLHRVYLIVGNEAGARTVTFHIQVLARREGGSPRLIEVPMTAYAQGHRPPEGDDPYVIAMHGQGFSYRSDSPRRANLKLDVIGRTPRRLDWDESIRASVAWVKLGRPSSDEHFLAPGSQARLISVNEQKNRLILLENGKLRTRFLDERQAVPVTVIAGNWLQVDGYPGADFYIEYDADQQGEATIHVLRGGVQLQLRNPWEVPDVFGELRDHERREERRRHSQSRQNLIYTIPAGQSVRIFDQVNRPPVVNSLAAPTVRELLRESSPHLWTLKPGKPDRGANARYHLAARLFDEKQKLGESDLLRLANRAIADRDYLLALDLLAQLGEIEKSYEALILAGQSFLGLGLTQRPRSFLRSAHALKKDDSKLHFLMAMSLLEEEKWDLARIWLKRARSLGSAEADQISYYLGVSSFLQGNWRKSAKSFQEVIRSSSESNLQSSSREFLLILEERRNFWAELGLAINYDSHIFRTSNEQQILRVDSNLKNAAPGILIRGQIKRRFSLGESFDLAFWGRFLRQDWQGNSEASRLEEAVGLETRYGRKKRLSLGIEAETILIGPRRALDGAGLRAGYRFSESYGRPTLYAGIKRYRDPFPAYADLIDPLADRWQGVSSDRSSRVHYFHLNLEGDLGARFSFQADTLLWYRLLDNSLARSLNERRYQQFARLSWRFHPSWDLGVELGLTNRLFSGGGLDRTDSVIHSGLGIGWQWHEHWSWKTQIARKGHSSERSDFDFGQIVGETGIVYQF